MRRPYLKQHMGLGQFEWLDTVGDDSLDVLDLGDSFDWGALDLGSDVDLADYGTDWGVEDYAVDYGSGSFVGWGEDDWGTDFFSAEGATDLYGDNGFDWSFADEDYGGDFIDSGTFDLGGDTFDSNAWPDATGNPWTEDFQFGDDPWGTMGGDDSLDILDIGDSPATSYGGGSFDIPWDKLIGAGVSVGTTLLQIDAAKSTQRAPTTRYVQPTTAPTKTVLPSVRPPTYVETRDPTTGQRVLIDPTTGNRVPSTIDRSTGRLIPTGPPQSNVGASISKFVKENPIPIIAGIALLGFVLLPDSTPKGK